MAEIGKSLKGIWLKSMEAISNTASNIASNTKYKVDEMNIVNRRREILSSFGAQCYEMWQKGEHFPENLEAQLQELSELDEALNAIRVEKVAGVKNDDEPAENDASAEGEETEGTEDTQDKAGVSEKIDNAVDAVGATFKKLGTKLEGGIEALTRAMKPKMEPDDQANKDDQPEADDVPVIQVEYEAPAEEDSPMQADDLPDEPKAPEITLEDDGEDEQE